MAALQAAVFNIGEETPGVAGKEIMMLKDKIEEFIKGGDRSFPVDLPQDYFPFSPSLAGAAAAVPGNPSKDSPAGSCSATNGHAWVSPNKSDEVPLSNESSPDAQSEQTPPEENEKLHEELNAKDYSEADVEPIAMKEKPDLDLSIAGESLEIQNLAAPRVTNDEAVLGASSEDFVKIIHGDKAIMLALPSEVSCEMGSTLELSETLAASLGITEEIIGLKTTAMLLDDDQMSKHHGDVVIPFSSLASGQLRRLLKNSEGIEGFPSFNLVTSNFDSYLENYQVTSAKSKELSSQGEESQSVSVREGALYIEAFIELMEKSEEFDPFQKNTLLRFGIDNAEQENVLFRASFRVAVYTGDMAYFTQGLKAIAKILLSPSISESDNASVVRTKQISMTIFGLTDFVIAADELFESSDFTAQQYATLLNAIFSGNSSVQSLFDLYHNPDFLLACDADLRASLCLRDLLRLGKKLEPLQPNSQDDENLKWAIRTGVHNFAARMSTELPEEFISIIYHMFSSGDEMVLAACSRFLDTADSDTIEGMLLREWDIFCRNKAFKEGIFDAVPAAAGREMDGPNTALESSLAKNFDIRGGEFPDVLLTAIAYLVDQQELAEYSAATLLASYAKGNRFLRDAYDHFIDFGGVDDFLDVLKVIASMDADQFGTSVSSDPGEHDPSESAHSALWSVLKDMRALGQVEIAALRLAAVRRDPQLTKALADFRDGCMDSNKVKQALLDVVDGIIQETDSDATA